MRAVLDDLASCPRSARPWVGVARRRCPRRPTRAACRRRPRAGCPGRRGPRARRACRTRSRACRPARPPRARGRSRAVRATRRALRRARPASPPPTSRPATTRAPVSGPDAAVEPQRPRREVRVHHAAARRRRRPAPSRPASSSSRPVGHLARAGDHVAQLAPRRLVDLADLEPGQDVVELVAQQHAPQRLERLARSRPPASARQRRPAPRPRRGRAPPGGAGAWSAPGSSASRGAAPGRARRPTPAARGGAAACGAVEERVDAAEALAAAAPGSSASSRDALDHLLGRPAAAVAEADRTAGSRRGRPCA